MGDLKHSGRRAFLKGASGMALALPLLEYTHGNAWARDGVVRRFVTVFSHGGTISNQAGNRTNEYGVPARHNGMGNIYNDTHHGEDWWRPALPDTALALGPIHQPLEPWREKLLVVEGVDNLSAVAADQYSRGGHGISNVTSLTAADVEFVTNGEDENAISMGPSIDQVIAERLAQTQPTVFDRIHLTVSGHAYGTPFFRAGHEPMHGMSNPVDAFNTLFEGVSENPEPSPAELLQRARRGSMLDELVGQYERFASQVSSKDKQAIEAHLDHLRQLEQELDNFVVCTPPSGIELPADPEGDVIGSLHAQILVAAIRCGLTHVANLEIADILTPWTDTGLLVESAFDIGHSLGHYSMDVGMGGTHESQRDDWLAEMLSNRQWRMSLLAQILEGLDDPTFLEGGNTILDNSLVFYTSEFRSANHIASNVPVLLAGSAGGYFDTGRFIDYNMYENEGHDTVNYESVESLHNLFTSFLNAFGEDDTHFGNGDARHEGPLPGLTV